VLIAPVQQFYHNGTGYDWISSELVCPVYRDEECGCKSVCGKETLLNKREATLAKVIFFVAIKVRGYLRVWLPGMPVCGISARWRKPYNSSITITYQ